MINQSKTQYSANSVYHYCNVLHILLDNTCQITHAFYLSPSNSLVQDIVWILSVCLLDYLQWLCTLTLSTFRNWPLARYVKLRVVHAPTMPGTFSPPRRVSDPGMDHGTCVTHVPGYMPRSLTSGFLWSRWRGKRSQHSRRMRNPYFYVSGKRPMASLNGVMHCNTFITMLHPEALW